MFGGVFRSRGYGCVVLVELMRGRATQHCMLQCPPHFPCQHLSMKIPGAACSIARRGRLRPWRDQRTNAPCTGRAGISYPIPHEEPLRVLRVGDLSRGVPVMGCSKARREAPAVTLTHPSHTTGAAGPCFLPRCTTRSPARGRWRATARRGTRGCARGRTSSPRQQHRRRREHAVLRFEHHARRCAALQ